MQLRGDRMYTHHASANDNRVLPPALALSGASAIPFVIYLTPRRKYRQLKARRNTMI